MVRKKRWTKRRFVPVSIFAIVELAARRSQSSRRGRQRSVRCADRAITIRGMHRLAAVALALLIPTPAVAQTDAVAARIDRILAEVPLIDGHNDLPYQYEERVKDHLAQIDLRQDQSKL